jgi:hypothetical protein
MQAGNLPVFCNLDFGVFRPGWIGTVVIGIVAAFASWASTKSVSVPNWSVTEPMGTGHRATAILIGFGGAKWLKTEAEKVALKRTAVLAAAKPLNAAAAQMISASTPFRALDTASKMPD